MDTRWTARWAHCGGLLLTVFAAGSALAPHSVQAAALFKCRGADGVPSYQSAPCAEPAQQLWQREVTPEPEPRATPQRSQSQQPARVRTRVVRLRTTRAAAPRIDACARARAAADDERDRRWYTITFDRLRQLDAMVARACK